MTRIKVLLIGLVLFDVVLGIGCAALPNLFAASAWPAVTDDGLVLLRRTGLIWCFFALAQLATLLRPTPERLRLVALLRWMDVPADTAWVIYARGLSPFGLAAIGGAPILNLIFGGLLWRAAARMATGALKTAASG